jgi:hypothetical protein
LSRNAEIMIPVAFQKIKNRQPSANTPVASALTFDHFENFDHFNPYRDTSLIRTPPPS